MQKPDVGSRERVAGWTKDGGWTTMQIGGQRWCLAGHDCEWPVAGGSQVTAEASRW